MYYSSCKAFIILINTNGIIPHYVVAISDVCALPDWVGYSYSPPVLSCHLHFFLVNYGAVISSTVSHIVMSYSSTSQERMLFLTLKSTSSCRTQILI